MRQKTVVAHANTEVDCEHIENGRDYKVGPTEEEERSYRADMEENHENGGQPVDRIRTCDASHTNLFTGSEGMTWGMLMFAPGKLSELSLCRRGSYSRFVLAYAMMVWHSLLLAIFEEVSIQASSVSRLTELRGSPAISSTVISAINSCLSANFPQR
jgi:hypothetical protein